MQGMGCRELGKNTILNKHPVIKYGRAEIACLSAFLSIYLFIYQSIYLSIYISVHVFVCNKSYASKVSVRLWFWFMHVCIIMYMCVICLQSQSQPSEGQGDLFFWNSLYIFTYIHRAVQRNSKGPPLSNFWWGANFEKKIYSFIVKSLTKCPKRGERRTVTPPPLYAYVYQPNVSSAYTYTYI